MQIPLVDVAWQHQRVRATLDRVFDQMLTDPTCDGAVFCKQLEADFVTYFGKSTAASGSSTVYAVSVQSGRAAQFLTLKALGIGPGDEVITVPNSDMATTAAISHTGASLVFVDVDAQTHNMDPTLLEAACTPRTRAIVPVHMYGLPAQMDAICEIAKRHDLFVVEDATLALGAEYQGQKVGLLGDAGFFSFAPRKVIGGIGNGGMVITKDAKLAREIGLLKGYGLPPERGEAPIAQRHLYVGLANESEGYNLKMDGIQAAIVSAKFAHLDEWANLRQVVADHYNADLATIPDLQSPVVPSGVRHGWRNYTIAVPHRNEVQQHLRNQGVTAATLYIPPVHLQPVYRHLGLGPGSFPVAEALAQTLLCLPIYPGMPPEQVDAVVSSIREGLS